MKPVALLALAVVATALLPGAMFLPPRGGFSGGGFVTIGPGVAFPSGCGAGASAPASVLHPAVTGTIRDFPEMGVRDQAPVGEDIQSSYFRTTETNREFRRGFMEFAIPRLQGKIQHATLVFAEGPGAVVPGAPDVDNELSWYRADLKVGVEDYDRPTLFLAGFKDDLQDPNNVWSFDVTSEVRGMQGGCLGFRVKLVLDPGHTTYGGFGTSIGRYSWIQPHIQLDFA